MSPYNTNIVGSLPNPTIDLIIGLLTYETLNSIHLELKNTASVDSNLGYGLIGVLTLTVSTTVYNTLSTTPFVVPSNSGPHNTGTGTSIQIVAVVWVHTKNTQMLRE